MSNAAFLTQEVLKDSFRPRNLRPLVKYAHCTDTLSVLNVFHCQRCRIWTQYHCLRSLGRYHWAIILINCMWGAQLKKFKFFNLKFKTFQQNCNLFEFPSEFTAWLFQFICVCEFKQTWIICTYDQFFTFVNKYFKK